MKDDRPSMPGVRNQQTIAHAAVVEGFGFWSSRDIRVEFRPAPDNTGIVFVRCDLDPVVKIPALVKNRIKMPRRTTLCAGGARVEMVEHIMATLAGLQIDNCQVWVSEQEMPGCDGSSQAFVDALDAAGIVKQDAPRPQLVIGESTRLGNEDCWIEAGPSAGGPSAGGAGDGDGLSVKFHIDYPQHPAIGRQTLYLEITPASFRSELASCRTFLLKHEAEWLQSQGLAQRATTADALVYDDQGPMDNEVRFADECVRHKILDLVGDLALAGCDIVGHVVVHCGGHRINSELVRVLLAEGQMAEPQRRCAWQPAGKSNVCRQS